MAKDQTERSEAVSDEWHEQLFAVRRSVRYHARRSQFFDHIDKVVKIMTAVSGVGTITTLLASTLGTGWTTGFAATVAFLSSVDLIVGFSKCGKLHVDLARRFIDLEREFARCGQDPDEADLMRMIERRLEIEKDEPAILRVLDTMCHNELMLATGYPGSERVKLSWLQRALAQICDVSPHRLIDPHAV